MTEALQDKRSHVRKPLTCTANVYQTQSGLPLGRISDVSKEGFMLRSHSRMSPKDVLELTLELPELDRTRSLEVAAQCIWCHPISGSKEFGAGFHIKAISDQDQVALNYFIRDF